MGLDFQCSFEGIDSSQLVSANARFHRLDSGGLGAGIQTTNVRTGTQGLFVGGTNNHVNRRGLANDATRIIGCAVRLDPAAAFPSGDTMLMVLLDGGIVGAAHANSDTQVGIGITSGGNICAYRGRATSSGGTKLGSDSSLGFTRGLYYFVEFVSVIHVSTGTVDVYVDGVSWLSLSGQNTQNTANAYSNGFALTGLGSSTMIDDLYVRSGTTTRYGPKYRCVGLLPSGGNGTNDQWTKSTGSDAGALLDENPPNTTDYISETTVGEKTTVPMANVGYTGTVVGVTALLYCQKGDVGARSIAPVQRLNGTDYDGTTVVLAQNFAYQVCELREVSQDTGVAYTTTEIDGMEFGAKLIA